MTLKLFSAFYMVAHIHVSTCFYYMYLVLVRVTIAVTKHQDKKSMLVYTSISLFFTEGSQDKNSISAGIWGQKPIQIERC